MKPAKDRMLVIVNTKVKDSYQLAKDVKIVMMRDEMQFDNRIKMPTQGKVYPTGEEVLLDHNSVHPVNLVNDHDIDLPENHGLYSIYKSEVYAYRHEDSEGWLPNRWTDDEGVEHGFLLVERIWQPYSGLIAGIPPSVIENRLFVTEGNYKHKVLATGKYCDYTMVFQDTDGRDAYLTRMRENEDEILAVDDDLTKKVLSGKVLIGETAKVARVFQQPGQPIFDSLW